MVKGVNEQNLLIGVLLVVALAIGVFLYRRGEEGYHGGVNPCNPKNLSCEKACHGGANCLKWCSNCLRNWCMGDMPTDKAYDCLKKNPCDAKDRPCEKVCEGDVDCLNRCRSCLANTCMGIYPTDASYGCLHK